MVDQVAVSVITGSGITGGAAATGVLSAKTTEAYVGSTGVVNAAGNSGGISTFDAGSDGEPVAVTVHGLAIRALNHDEFLSVAIGGGGAPIVNVAASAVAHATDNTTRAYIDGGAKVNEINTGAGAAQDVDLLAFDHTDIAGVAGGVSIGSIVGIGASATGGNIEKLTEAFIGPDAVVTANSEVGVRAATHEDVLGIAATLSIDEVVGIVGAGGGYRFAVTTRARITGADVESDGNVVVAADADTEVVLVQGTLTISNPVSIGVSAGGVLLEKVTEAYIDGNAEVDAFAGGAPAQVATGAFGIGYTPFTGDMKPHISQIPPVTDTPIPTSVVTGVDAPIAGTPPADQQLSGVRGATPLFEVFRGVAVTATNRDGILVIAAGVGVSNGFSLPVSGSADVSMSETRAYVAGGAQVNTAGSTSTDQEVRIVAAHDHSYVAVSGSLTGFGVFDVTPAASIGLIRNTTEAFVNAAGVEATSDITIQARATEDVIAIAAVLTGDEAFSITGSATAFALDNITRAYISGLSTVTADGTVAVAASDESSLTLVAGAVQAANTVGIGASLGVAMVVKDTRAFIDGNSSVDGKAINGDGFAAYDGDVPVDGAFPTHAVRGVVVQAYSLESIVNVSVAGTAAATVALVGAASVTIIDADTTAFIGDAQINQLSGADPDQAVAVIAANDVDVFSAGGAGVIKTTVAIGASADIGLIRNDVSAFIAGGAVVDALDGVDVLALSRKTVLAFSVSLNGTTVGLAGAVSMWTIGSFADGESRAMLRTITADQSPLPGGVFPDLASSVDGMLADLVEALADALESEHDTPSAAGDFNSKDDVDGEADTIALTPGHGFLAGDAAKYTAPDGDDVVGGLESGRTYFVGRDPDDVDKVTLHANRDDAIAGRNAIDIVPASDGTTHTLAAVPAGDAPAKRIVGPILTFWPGTPVRDGLEEGGFVVDPTAGDVDTDDETITLGVGHGLLAGDALVYDNGGGTEIGGLDRTKTYYVSLVGNDKVKLHATREDAIAGENELDLNAEAATGTQHRFDRLLTKGTSAWVELATVDAGGDVRILAEERIAATIIPGAASVGGTVGISGAMVVGLRAQPGAVVRRRGGRHRRGRRRRDHGDGAQHDRAQRLRAEPQLQRVADLRLRPQRLLRARRGAAGRDRRRRRRQRDRAEHQRLRDHRELVRLREHRRVRPLDRDDRHRPHLDLGGTRARHRDRGPQRAGRLPLGQQQDDLARVRLRHRAAREQARRPRLRHQGRRLPGQQGHRQRHRDHERQRRDDPDRRRRHDRQQRQPGRGFDRRRRHGHGRGRRHLGQGAGRGQPPDQRLRQRQRRQHPRRGRRRDVHRPRQRGRRLHRRRRRRRDGHDARAGQRARPEPDHRLLGRVLGRPGRPDRRRHHHARRRSGLPAGRRPRQGGVRRRF